MQHLESYFEGTKSRISKRDGGESLVSRPTLGAGGAVVGSDHLKSRISDFNLPIAHVPKHDMSHMSDDVELHFWIQQNTANCGNNNNNNASSMGSQNASVGPAITV